MVEGKRPAPRRPRRRGSSSSEGSSRGATRTLIAVAIVAFLAGAGVWVVLQRPRWAAEKRIAELRPTVEMVLGAELGDSFRVQTVTQEELASELLSEGTFCPFLGRVSSYEIRLADNLASQSGSSQEMDLFLVHHLVHLWQEQNDVPKLTRGAESAEVGKVRHALREGQAILLMQLVSRLLDYEWKPEFSPDEDGVPHEFTVGMLAMAAAMSKDRDKAPLNAAAALQLLDEPPRTMAALRARVAELEREHAARQSPSPSPSPPR